ncbi:MAG TPA: JAB domain-containing protein, partial [Sphingobacteriaceae bacterium]
FRGDDLLYLKYFFFNARISGNRIRRTGEPLYLYIKLPSQHITEELLTDIPDSRQGFTRTKSFLAKSSWLGFKLSNHIDSIKFNVETLLNWSENFELLTVDDFAKNNGSQFSGYGAALKGLKNEFQDQTLADIPVMHSHSDPANPASPITTFEVPFKILLSPIAKPSDDKAADYRTMGEHIFTDNNQLKIHYQDKRSRSQHISIVSVWENRLMFRDRANNLSEPRFKALRAICQEDGIDNGVRLLPSPVNREDIKELTSLPAYDRDILTEFFKISALGITTNLKYHNEDPTVNHALVAWGQRIKYSRDNYVSVTFRAIDVFTGLKLHISIIADRRFKSGVSFMPELYYVSYAEPEKTYSESGVVSKLPFVKIIPQTDGAFFHPHTFAAVNPAINTAYLAGKSKSDIIFNGASINCNNLLEFEYIGIDKNNVSHKFKSKIVFIPAESYVIKQGPFLHYKATERVELPHIGFLNPAREDRMINVGRRGCVPGTADTYIYSLIKNFSSNPAVAANLATNLVEALKGNASSIILAHNHPSGNLKPSEAD